MDILLVELVAAAFAYAAFSITLQRKLSNIDKMYEIRATMNTKTKDLMRMAKEKADKATIDAAQKELAQLSMDSMKNQMKPMLIVLPVFFLIYYVLLPMGFAPKLTLQILSFTLGYQQVFILAAFVSGLVLSTRLSMRDRKRLRSKYDFGLLQPSLKQQ
jgi:uncharacterized membrane protein (DUF106 family)